MVHLSSMGPLKNRTFAAAFIKAQVNNLYSVGGVSVSIMFNLPSRSIVSISKSTTVGLRCCGMPMHVWYIRSKYIISLCRL